MKADTAMMDAIQLRRRICFWLIVFIVGLVLSGLTAFPLVSEVKLLHRILDAIGVARWFPSGGEWIGRVDRALIDADNNYPFLFYGTDWLAFAHLTIAIAFSGPLRDPVKNIWVIEFGMITCAAVIPLAMIAGPIRGIPFFWRLIDCSFSVVGIIPLWLAYRYTKAFKRLSSCSCLQS